MPIQYDVPPDWDAIPDPPASSAYQRRPRPESRHPAWDERDRVELDTLRANRDHYQQIAIQLKTQLDAAHKQLAQCTCNQAGKRRRV